MKTLTIILLLTLMGCSKVIYPGHDYYDRLVVGTTKNAYLTEDFTGGILEKFTLRIQIAQELEIGSL